MIIVIIMVKNLYEEHLAEWQECSHRLVRIRRRFESDPVHTHENSFVIFWKD